MQDPLSERLGFPEPPRLIDNDPQAFAFLPFFAAPLLAEEDDWLARLGGRSETDASGGITSLNLRGSWIDDTEMFDVADLPA